MRKFLVALAVIFGIYVLTREGIAYYRWNTARLVMRARRY
jgi:hypothetical protein